MITNVFLQFARQYSKNDAITFTWLCKQIGWPLTLPKTILDLVHLEAVFDVLDLYLWLSYRFIDLFPDTDTVRDMQKELDAIIQAGIVQLTRLLKNSESGKYSRTLHASALTTLFLNDLYFFLQVRTVPRQSPTMTILN